MGTVYDELDAAITTLLDVDPHDLSDDDLDDAVVAIQRHTSRLAAARARLISAWDHRHLWASDGSRSPAARLARDASIAPPTAAAEVRRARALRTMPHTAAALAEGALSPDHVDLLARVDTGSRQVVFADHEETLVAQCKLLRFSDACRMVAYWRQRADAETIEDEGRRLHEGRTASAATTFDGVVDLRALFDPLGGAEFLTELQRLERHAVPRGPGTRRPVPHARATPPRRLGRDGPPLPHAPMTAGCDRGRCSPSSSAKRRWPGSASWPPAPSSPPG